MTSLFPSWRLSDLCGRRLFSNPKEIQNRFHVLEVSATGSGLRDLDVPS